MAGLGVALDAEQRAALSWDRRQVDLVEDLARVALHVLGCEAGAVALAHALPVVLAVLELAQLGRRGQIGLVLVADARIGESCLQALGVRPRVLAPAHAAALADVDDPLDARLAK